MSPGHLPQPGVISRLPTLPLQDEMMENDTGLAGPTVPALLDQVPPREKEQGGFVVPDKHMSQNSSPTATASRRAQLSLPRGTTSAVLTCAWPRQASCPLPNQVSDEKGEGQSTGWWLWAGLCLLTSHVRTRTRFPRTVLGDRAFKGISKLK